MIRIYGIKNCDSCRKAMAWLQDNEIEFEFHDYRVKGLEVKVLQRWIDLTGWEILLNRRSTTWRKLQKSEKENLDSMQATELMNANPTLIKRPVFEVGSRILIGFTKREKEFLAGNY